MIELQTQKVIPRAFVLGAVLVVIQTAPTALPEHAMVVWSAMMLELPLVSFYLSMGMPTSVPSTAVSASRGISVMSMPVRIYHSF